MKREASLAQIEGRRKPFDIVVIGGGATGAGVALDAASRGLSVVLLERDDFSAGTSSRSTKIIHGGVRYLAQGRIGLVREALRERACLLRIASHVVRPLAFVVPAENLLERAKYSLGLKVYDALAGRHGIADSEWLTPTQLRTSVPTLADRAFLGGTRYFDAQFDDARLLIDIVRASSLHGACVLNYAEVVDLAKGADGRIRAVCFRDRESGDEQEIETRCVVNATGAASDDILRLDNPAQTPSILPSQGSHIVVERRFLPGSDALLMPRTPDGRIMFAIPWLGHVLIGTTDTPVSTNTRDPIPGSDEIAMILDVAADYLAMTPRREDILSTFAGIRPLVRPSTNAATANASREHRIDVGTSGLVTVSGGKWTTYRLMAAACVDIAAQANAWRIPPSPTATLQLDANAAERDNEAHRERSRTPSEADGDTLPDEALSESLPYTLSDCVRAVRHEMARTIEDVLARRTRALFLNADAAIAAAPAVADVLARELHLDRAATARRLDDFRGQARRFQWSDRPARDSTAT